jgi:GT2 family glycosyltransferase
VAAGGYYAPFFIGHEGPDLCLRLMKKGFSVWYSPEIEVIHYASAAARPDSRAYYFNTRNNIWLAYRHYPAGYAIRYMFFYTGMSFIYALKNRQIVPFAKGVIDAVRNIRHTDRFAISRDLYAKLKEITYFRPSVWRRIQKHILSRQAYR